MLRRTLLVVTATFASLLLFTGSALACGGLVNSNGTVTLVRTTTLAAYHDGVEHYVTSFQFAGGEGEFGSIIPLPGVPTKVIRGGDWTLQRLVQETQPQLERFALAGAAAVAEDSATVILKTKIDALDIVVLEGGGTAVGNWAREHGFFLPPDAPEVLDFYAERSPIFMAVRFDASRAAEQGLGAGDGTPVHVVIPTSNPWVPLRILGLGAVAEAPVEADVYLLTDREPALLPEPVSPAGATFLEGRGVQPGLVLEASQPASGSLIADLRSDKGMKWLPTDDVWLTYLRLDASAGDLIYDLAVDASGAGRPSPVAAGLEPEASGGDSGSRWMPALWVALALLVTLGAVGAFERRRFGRPAV
ncbi:MAG: DUF2330 domain-containing protein [Actinomycetota bacterium]